MARLGYTRYAVQGGDAGAGIGRQVALDDARHVVGLHLNYCASPPPPGDPKEGVSADEWKRMEEREVYFDEHNNGWLAIQTRKPQTLGYAFTDSPVGLAAWLVDKWRTLCDCDGHPEKVFTKDELLTNVMIYWVTETSASHAAVRIRAPQRQSNDGLRETSGGWGYAPRDRSDRVCRVSR